MIWPTKKLGEVLDKFDRGISWSKKDETSETDGMPVLRIPNILLGEIIKDDLKYIKISQPGEAILEKEDIVMVASNGNPNLVARSALATEGEQGMLFASFLVRLRFNQNKILSRYVHLFFQTPFFKKEVRRKIATTSGIYNLKKEHIERLQIPYPPLVIQYKIIERLDAIRKAQELNDKQIALADELFQSLLHDELDSKNSNTRKLGEFCEINPKTDLELNRNNIKYVEMASIDENLKEIKYFLERPIDKTSSGLTRFRNKDIIFARITPCTENGKFAFVENCPTTCVGSTEFHVLRTKQNELLPRFLFYWLNISKIKKMAVASMIGSTGRQRVPAEFFHYIKIPLPPLATQRQIVEKFQAVQGYKKKLLEQKQKLQELFASCLDKAMKGELVS